MQWRGILVVIVVIVDVIVFATVFLQFEGNTEKTPASVERGEKWLKCVILNGGDKNKCLKEGEALAVPEATAVTVLFLLSCNGFWVAVFLGRWSMITGWLDFFRKPKPADEFVSLGVARPTSFGPNPRTYTDLPSSATNYSDDRFRDEYSKESYEMGGKQTSIMIHESFRPKKTTRRSFSQPNVGIYKKNGERPPVVQEDEELGNIGYSATVTAGPTRPDFNRSVTQPIGVARTSSLRNKELTPTQELEALEMSIASASRGRQNQRAAFPSAHRV
ncbi:hypothetical protein ABW19_dt0206008 [Dactylella cylindrospora]|nr:hypothetical protein ABW19_dt0206008 [Dactylella cylindrospora]